MLDAVLEQAEMPAEIDKRAALVGELELCPGDDDRRAVVALFRPRLHHDLADGGGLVAGQSREIKPGLAVGADFHVIGHVREGELSELGQHVLLADRELRDSARRRCRFDSPAPIRGLVHTAAPPARADSATAMGHGSYSHSSACACAPLRGSEMIDWVCPWGLVALKSACHATVRRIIVRANVLG